MVESPGLVCLLTIVCIINGFIGKEKASMGVWMCVLDGGKGKEEIADEV